MLAVGFLVGAFALGPGLGLAPDDEPVPPPPLPIPAPPSPPGTDVPVAALVLGLGAIAAAIAAQKPGSALGLRPPEDAMVVFVPGHGQGTGRRCSRSSSISWDSIRMMPGTSITAGSRGGRPAGGLDARLRSARLPHPSTPISPVWPTPTDRCGLSGSARVEPRLQISIAAWDRGLFGPTANVEGAMLLDPPMARGIHGTLQSAGTVVGPVPDDGGYDPVDCSFLWFGCHDDRAYLGDASGIEVIVVRNPRAAVTSFSDHPPGLRVVDAPDDGPGPWGQVFKNPFKLFSRIAEAHESVLSDPEVVRCLVSEMQEKGSCSLDLPDTLPADASKAHSGGKALLSLQPSVLSLQQEKGLATVLTDD